MLSLKSPITHMAYHGNKSDIGHTRIKQKYYNNADEKEKQKKRKATAQHFALHANANARKDNL